MRKPATTSEKPFPDAFFSIFPYGESRIVSFTKNSVQEKMHQPVKKILLRGIIFTALLYIPPIITAASHPWSSWKIVSVAPGFSCLFLAMITTDFSFDLSNLSMMIISAVLTLVIIASLAVLSSSGKIWICIAVVFGAVVAWLSGYVLWALPRME